MTQNILRIMGIDPGINNTGYGFIDNISKDTISYIDCGNIEASKTQPYTVKLKKIYKELIEVIAFYKPNEVAIEDIYVHKNSRSALKLGCAKGVAILAVLNSGLEIFEYTPTQIKKAIGFGMASKDQIKKMLKLYLKVSTDIPYHSSDAIAIAICHANMNTYRRKILKAL